MDALHTGGKRAAKPLVKVNCSALPEHLVESELFGHVRGAFTGANRSALGRIQAAQGGTLFLDEIGELSPSVQVKLLRVLENREFERVGDVRTITADVRIITATNVDLSKKVREGSFREDLFHRLNVVTLCVPPLRDRAADIPALAAWFLKVFCARHGKTVQGISQDVLDIFRAHHWPGNVRELKNVMESAVVHCPGGAILPEHLPRQFSSLLSHQATGMPSKEDILAALESSKWKKARAARLLNVERTLFYRLLRKYDVDCDNP